MLAEDKPRLRIKGVAVNFVAFGGYAIDGIQGLGNTGSGLRGRLN